MPGLRMRIMRPIVLTLLGMCAALELGITDSSRGADVKRYGLSQRDIVCRDSEADLKKVFRHQRYGLKVPG